jgi:hypothetical protein
LQKRKRDHALEHMTYDLQKQKWVNANKKCVAIIKNTIQSTIMRLNPRVWHCHRVPGKNKESVLWFFKDIC